MLNIMECTLRDGSYATGFQFSDEFTVDLALKLENVGFRFIEVGHGVGLNASQAGKRKAISTDMEYMESMFRQLKKAKWGMFFIPGIGQKYDLKLAAKYEMDFVRIGTNVTQIEEAEEYVKLAKDLGFIVTSNLMKSYVLQPSKFVKKAKLAEKYGVDIVYIVDSAGYMVPNYVEEYVTQLKASVAVDIGFHGHDNLNLALANTLRAIECGATYVDATLQGVGRSAGNVQLETLIFALAKMGYKLGINGLNAFYVGHDIHQNIGILLIAINGWRNNAIVYR